MIRSVVFWQVDIANVIQTTTSLQPSQLFSWAGLAGFCHQQHYKPLQQDFNWKWPLSCNNTLWLQMMRVVTKKHVDVCKKNTHKSILKGWLFSPLGKFELQISSHYKHQLALSTKSYPAWVVLGDMSFNAPSSAKAYCGGWWEPTNIQGFSWSVGSVPNHC